LPPEQQATAAPTPMMKQYLSIKAGHTDCLLFYRMGDFYELFFDDAVIAAQTLGITLTKRGKHAGSDIPMCGVPVHTADDYLQKLIAGGHRVAVCEQTESPAEAKKRGAGSVVDRNVIRLVTPGTITEEKLLDPARANYLMALGRVKNNGADNLALAWIDISTGAFHVLSSAPEHLLADIMRIDPQELVLAEDVFHDPVLRPAFDVIGRVATPQPASLFNSATAQNRITAYYQVATLDGFADFSRAELAAISGIIAYVEKTQVNERAALMRPTREENGAVLFIDPATRQNLELTRTLSGKYQGSLLHAIDRTLTGTGARLLAERLTAPLTASKQIIERLDTIAFFRGEVPLCQAVRAELKGVPDMARALARLALRRGSPRDFAAILRGMEAVRMLCSLFQNTRLPTEVAAAQQALAALPAALNTHLSQALADELPLLKRDGGFIRSGYHEELDEMRDLRDESRKIVTALQNRYADETGVKALKIKHNNILGFFIEVTSNQSAALTEGEQTKARFIHRQTMANAMRFTTAELAELENRIASAAERALVIEFEIFDKLTAEVCAAADSIRNAALALAVFDVSTALTILADEQAWCRPTVDDSLTFSIDGGRHPVVEQALRRQAADPFIANDCDLSPANADPYGAIWLLTGPNMGGKSTFLRQNALIAILAQTGSYVPADFAHIGVVDRLFSRVGASDDLARGRSTFMVEMVETAAILNQAGERALVILDEIGRGTATFDGLAIAWAAVEYLHEVNHCRAIFATHFHEMTALTEKLPRLSNHTMTVREWNGEVIFLHEVSAGTADRSYGVQVAKLAGLPPSVVARARDVLQQLEQGETAGKAHKLVDDLPLFSASAATAAETKAATPSAVEKALKALNPDTLAPREALEELYRLKALL